MKIAWIVILTLEIACFAWACVQSNREARNSDAAASAAFGVLFVLFASAVIDVLLGIASLIVYFVHHARH